MAFDQFVSQELCFPEQPQEGKFDFLASPPSLKTILTELLKDKMGYDDLLIISLKEIAILYMNSFCIVKLAAFQRALLTPLKFPKLNPPAKLEVCMGQIFQTRLHGCNLGLV